MPQFGKSGPQSTVRVSNLLWLLNLTLALIEMQSRLEDFQKWQPVMQLLVLYRSFGHRNFRSTT